MAIDYTAYPDAVDVSLLLKSAKYWPSDSDTTGQALALNQAEIAVNGAVAEFERRTGWRPFLAGDTATTRYFTATDHYGLLDLSGSIMTVSGITVADTALVLNTGYYIDRYNDDEPLTNIQFSQPYGIGSNMFGAGVSRPRQIAVTGIWGRVTLVPADVWQVVQQYAAGQTLMVIENLQSVASLSMDGLSKALDIVGINTQKDAVGLWPKNWDKIIYNWQRVVV